MGTKKRPFWRIVAIDSRSSRDGRFIEILGHYNPMVEPPELKVDDDRIYYWLDQGALPSEKVGILLKKLGLTERWRLMRAGATIQEVDTKIAERRLKQPKAVEGKEKKQRPGKKKAAKAAAAAKAAEGAEGPSRRPRKKGNGSMSTAKIKTMVRKISEMLVDKPDKIVIEEEKRDETYIIVLSVAKDDVGKIIGRSGQTAKALRALVNAAATRLGQKVLLEIRE